MKDLKPTLFALAVFGCFLLVFALIANAQAISQTKAAALKNAKTYLIESSGEVWNASDFQAVAYFGKKYSASVLPGALSVDLKKKFNTDQYSFTGSLLKPTLAPPSDFEMGLGSPEWYYKIYSCEDITSQDFSKLEASINSKDEPYAATHAIFFLDQIADTYELNCGKTAQASTASSLKTIVKEGLVLTDQDNSIPGWFDAYLSQECARGLVLGTVNPSVMSLVLSTQDKNALDKNTMGGWYSGGKRLNQPYSLPIFEESKDFPGQYFQTGSEWVYPELPNGHTTSMAICLLLIDLGVTT